MGGWGLSCEKNTRTRLPTENIPLLYIFCLCRPRSLMLKVINYETEIRELSTIFQKYIHY